MAIIEKGALIMIATINRTHPTKRVHFAIMSNDGTMKSTACNLTRSFPKKGFHKSWGMTVPFLAVTKSSKFTLSPGINFSLICQTSGVESTSTQLNNLFPAQTLQQLWGVLISFNISMTSYSVLGFSELSTL